METTNDDLKSYCLSHEEVESLLKADYGDKIKPVNQGKLQQLRRQQQLEATMQNAFKARRAEMVNVENEKTT